MALKLLDVNLSNIGTILGLITAIFGFLGWILMRFLDDKKDKTIYRMEIDQLKKDMADLRKRMDESEMDREKLSEKCHTMELKIVEKHNY